MGLSWRRLSRVSITVLAVALVMCFVVMPAPVRAAYVVINPSSADNEIENWDPNTNYGSVSFAYVRSGGPMDVSRILIKFDLSIIPAGARINSALLLLYYFRYVNADPAGRTYNTYRLTQSWTELGSTWNSRDTGTPWTTAGGVWTAEDSASSIVPATTGQWMSWDVTGIVKDWIENGQANNGFIVRDQNDGVSGTDAAAAFYMKDGAPRFLETPVLKVDWTTAKPVGGLVMSTNKLEILAPFLALTGLVAAVSAVVIVKRRNKD